MNGAMGGIGLAMQQEQAGNLMATEYRRPDVTMRQNIDRQIEIAKAHVAQLEETKARMETSGILDVRIDDMQRAMQF